jgi:Calx-beta domain/Bacterial TSP3 repeat
MKNESEGFCGAGLAGSACLWICAWLLAGAALGQVASDPGTNVISQPGDPGSTNSPSGSPVPLPPDVLARIAAAEELHAETNNVPGGGGGPQSGSASLGSTNAPPPPQWVAGEDKLFRATNTTFSATLTPDIDTIGALSVTIPGPGKSGTVLSGTVLGLAYCEPGDNGLSMIIGNVKSCLARMTTVGRIEFQDAFDGDGVDADVVYQLTRHSVSQEVIIRGQLPGPEYYGLSSNSYLAIVSEFYNPPAPAVQAGTAGNSDQTLRWGPMYMAQGRALAIGAETGHGAAVQKAWTQSGGRQFLMEMVPEGEIRGRMGNLPVLRPVSPPGKGGQGSLGPMRGLKRLLARASLVTAFGVRQSSAALGPGRPSVPRHRGGFAGKRQRTGAVQDLAEHTGGPLALQARSAKSQIANPKSKIPAGLLIDYTLTSDPIINIDFAPGNSQGYKYGAAAIGQNYSSDTWNDFDFCGSDGQLSDLQWADAWQYGGGHDSMASVTVTGLSGCWSFDPYMNPIDPMYDGYMYSSSGTITLSYLPAGTYDFYIYGHGPSQNANTYFTLNGSTLHTADSDSTWDTANWTEGSQYVVFGGVTVAANSQVVITVSAGTSGYALLNGMQIVQTASGDRAPYFTSNPVTLADATVGSFYTADVASHAYDPDGDALTFYISGDAKWLTSSYSGGFEGTPSAADVGQNTWTIVVEDPSGLYGYGTLDINVQAAQQNTLAEAVDEPAWNFSTGGNASWFYETSTTYSGGDAAQSDDITDNQSTYMQTTVTGSGTIGFYWKVSSENGYDYLSFYIDGVLQSRICGEVGWTYAGFQISGSGSHTLRWEYAKDVSVSVGSDCAWVDDVQFTPGGSGISIGEAVDNTALSWTTGGDRDWFGEASTYYSGGDAAQSGDIDNNQQNYVQTTVTGPGQLGFCWKVSSEPNYDFLRFSIDGVEQENICGEVGWTSRTYDIASGTHTLKWAYTKDVSVSDGSDCGWLDLVTFAEIPPPTITGQPQGKIAASGDSVTLSVSATGASGYQWFKDGVAVQNATSASLAFASVSGGNSGSYYVHVSNSSGSVDSSHVPLAVITAQPQSQTVVQGLPATFSVSVSSPNTPSYQWQFNGADISGATASAYTKSAVRPADAGTYSARVTVSGFNGDTGGARLVVEADSDGDFLPDVDEATYGTDPNNPDTDGDGRTDWQEIYDHTDPLDAGSKATWPVVSDRPYTASPSGAHKTGAGPTLVSWTDSGTAYFAVENGDPDTYYDVLGAENVSGPYTWYGTLRMGAQDVLKDPSKSQYFYRVGVPTVTPTIAVTATDPEASETGLQPGAFTLTRQGGTMTQPLLVGFTVSGTATPGVDYQALGGSAVFPAGASSVAITITPLDDNVSEGNETVVLTLNANSAYTLGSSSSATVTILDKPTISVSATDASAGEPSDTGTFTITRDGPTDAALAVAFAMSGTAVSGADYTIPASPVTISSGSSSKALVLTPINDTVYKGTRTATLSLSDAQAYMVSTRTADISISDDDWAVDKNNDGLPDGWEFQYWGNTGYQDKTADPDGDGLSNLQEYEGGYDPLKADTDGNGVPDGYEDKDGDGLANLMEAEFGTDPWSFDDVNADHIADWREDMDGDGLPDAYERNISRNTDPTVVEAAPTLPAALDKTPIQ